MTRLTLPLMLAIVTVASAAVARGQVHDNAKLFTVKAVDDANVRLGELESTYGKQLIVETFAAVPADQRAAMEQDKAAYFKKWKVERATALQANGVYVLICLDPKQIEDGAGKNTVARGIFTDGDLTQLRAVLVQQFKAKQFDAGLTAAIDLVAKAYADRIGNGGAPATRPANAPVEPPQLR